ncbi:DUF7544 domain-containing protein [Haloarcula pellucida]|uniref:Glycerophosphoryl diester phosphodiesterase membrane domain-containing protein n=1 Tax=Haloarcula pellucida TaxID=1427151 RepID=A0A830GMZ9_9EURY|nr:hypothetical protein [Halomicroarcula pellucida]MBX0349773.1 hypothetical protein [Halomicroarcula pellucida]GGN94246.1 hypothetical protein GCM10009030_20440 [Halomicroarcula pellucida]
MVLYAVEDIEDALAATRAFLWPIDRSRWLRLALVVFFVGGTGANVNTVQFNMPFDQGTPPGGAPPIQDIGPRIWFLVAAIVAVALLVGLAFLLVGSIMEFVLVESLRTETVAIRQSWRDRWRQGLRLFGFRVLVGLVVLSLVAGLLALVLVPVLTGTGGPAGLPAGGASVAALVLVLPVVVLISILAGLVGEFTTVFVVPIMVLEDCPVLGGWARLWRSIKANPWQYVAYAVVAFVLTLVGGLVVTIAVAIAAVLLLIPFGILGAIGFVLFTAVPSVGLAVLALVGLASGLSVVVAAAFVQVPVVTYLRYYALFVLGDVDDELDLVPERRATVRADEA